MRRRGSLRVANNVWGWFVVFAVVVVFFVDVVTVSGFPDIDKQSDYSGIRDNSESERGAMKILQNAAVNEGNAGDAVQGLWEFIKLKNQVREHSSGS